MRQPLILSTWSFGKRANAAAWPILARGGAALDAVEAAAREAEADPENHTVGFGGYPDASGRVSVDASIMLSPARRGAVAGLRRQMHPISVARRVMELTPHVLIVGPDADEFARACGFPEQDLLTDAAREAWERWKQSQRSATPIANIEERKHWPDEQVTHDTIGVLARDCAGHLAGACTTSGLAFKMPGRVGDSPIVGHGLYVDPTAGAAVCTGHGELVMGVCGSFLAVEQMRHGASPASAAAAVIERIKTSYDLRPDDQVGVITLSREGGWGCAALRAGFRVAIRTDARDELVDVFVS
ncbi:MAG: isoaspartyl peptidase/L-asparaginase [Phycisphaerae bacterium]|nr:isoaspartyl peptidase/L-asparaginase [Phycisphaerae bacterium]MDW8261378.1 isoaspartyl peptidase/L-asparaginase [Phycisphaerales bacterium]